MQSGQEFSRGFTCDSVDVNSDCRITVDEFSSYSIGSSPVDVSLVGLCFGSSV